MESFNPVIGETLEYTSVKKIGAGGFSTVTLIQDAQQKEMAYKYINPSQTLGVESILEPYIMSYIKHPSINTAISVNLDDSGGLGIVQNLSSTDLGSRRLNRNAETVRLWLWQITCGIAHMHRHGILHGDIKAENILLFKNTDGTYNCRVNDFSYSRLIVNPKVGIRDHNRYNIYTVTHRPIEVWKHLFFSFPADIWALGCTFYEIAYNTTPLFPRQCVSKSYEIDSYLKVFELWENRQIVNSPTFESIERNYPHSAPLQSIPENTPPPFNFHSKWSNPENEILNELILGMLNINPDNRYTIWDILNHQYFDPLRDDPLLSKLAPSYADLGYNFFTFDFPIDSKILQYTDEEQVIQLAAFLHHRSKQSSCKTVTMLAHKILHRGLPIKIKYTNEDLSAEIQLLRSLKFQIIP